MQPDMRPIREPILCDVLDGGCSVHLTIQCEHEIPGVIGGAAQYLLWYDAVEQWLWKWIEWHPGITTEATSNFFGYELNYQVQCDYYDDIPKLKRAFHWWVQHLLSCISWYRCPVCENLHFKFIDPLDLDIEEESTCGCTPDQVKDVIRLQKELANGIITMEEYDIKFEEVLNPGEPFE